MDKFFSNIPAFISDLKCWQTETFYKSSGLQGPEWKFYLCKARSWEDLGVCALLDFLSDF